MLLFETICRYGAWTLRVVILSDAVNPTTVHVPTDISLFEEMPFKRGCDTKSSVNTVRSSVCSGLFPAEYPASFHF